MQLPQQFVRRHTLIISGQQVRQLLGMDACIQAVEGAFRLHGEGRAETPAVASVRTVGGGFHVKAGVLGTAAGEYFAAKTNANFPANPAERGLPTIQGTIVLHDAVNGFPLAVLDSMEITAMRTAAATAVAARHLARRDAKTLAIIGCGLQGAQHLAALRLVRPLERVVLYDSDEAAARRLAGLAGEAGIPAALAPSAGEAANGVDLCVTCTSSTDFLLDAVDVAPGTFVDAEHKRELAPELLARSKVVVDVLAQCAGFGDLRHAIDAGVMSSADVHAELGGVVAGIQPGRVSEDEIIVFDSTGMALQDVAAAALVYERARAAGLGVAVDFAA
jgi:ornithine cyclodeaminase/alanine dehydrogenase-like protein (mu-crystallin family)